MRIRTALPAAAVFLVLVSVPALAQKTDVIELFNGDHVTCEIKSYSQGRLVVSTDIASDISVKWNKIVSITSDKVFEIETTDGLVHYGTLAASTPPGKLDVVSASGTESLDFMSVVRIAPIYQTFWKRWDGSFDLGFNYTQASQYVQFTVNGDATFRRPTFQSNLVLSMFFTSQNGVPSSQRGNLSFSYEKFLKDRWLVIGLAGVSRNLDLGLNWRYSLGGGYGRDFVQTNRTTFTAVAGILGDREEPVVGEIASHIAALVAGRFTTFTYDFPKLTFNATLQVIPYLDDFGRVRLEFNTYVKREIARDFYLSLTIFDSFDSRDPTTQQPKNDWGPVLAIGYTF
jgi:Protein of unknown function, DUF481